MEQLSFTFQVRDKIAGRAHVGVVGSGNLEILVEPGEDFCARVDITTSLPGNSDIWKYVLQRFFEEYPICVKMEINDFGATPGVVSLRLLQAWEVCNEDEA